MFKNMNEEHLKLLERLFERYSFRSGTVVVKQGEPADFLYLVISGKAQVSFKPYDGSPITISHVGKDSLFGWSAVVGSQTYTSSVTAIDDLETYRIRGSRLRNLCIQYPEAGRDILERLAGAVSSRWKNAQEQVKAILVQGMQT
jgi:CRP/FNR family cyclic AMP-dependent transcriptional regulator